MKSSVQDSVFTPSSVTKMKKIPIPPRSVVRLKKLWPHARKQGHEIGEIRIIGYYSKQDGLDCVWLANTAGNYDWTTDHEWLYEKFEVLEFSDETDLYGKQGDEIQGLE